MLYTLRAKYRQLNYNDRWMINHLRSQNYSIRYIARILRRSASTISRELKRNSLQGNYDPEMADDLAHARKCVYATKSISGGRRITRKFSGFRRFSSHKRRSLVAWESDTYSYFYERIWFLPKQRVRRKASRFWVKMDDKPDHFSKLRAMKKLLLMQDEFVEIQKEIEKKKEGIRKETTVKISSYYTQNQNNAPELLPSELSAA